MKLKERRKLAMKFFGLRPPSWRKKKKTIICEWSAWVNGEIKR